MRFWVCQRNLTRKRDYKPKSPPNLKAPWGSPKQRTNNQHLKCEGSQALGSTQHIVGHSMVKPVANSAA